MLSDRQLRAFDRDGYLIVPGAVSRALVDRALYAINHSLGFTGLPPDDLPRMRSQSYCDDVRGTPAAVDLVYRSAVWPAAEALVGGGNLQPATRAQVALRFPGHGGEKGVEQTGHLDGVGNGINGIPKGEFRRNFTMLAVILLSDLPEPYMGNFTVWPGSHRTAEAFFRDATPEVLRRGRPRYALPEPPVQVTGRAGDLCLAHHQLWHGAAPNRSPHIRYAAIFRLRHAEVDTLGTDAMTDIWREFEPVRAAAAAV